MCPLHSKSDITRVMWSKVEIAPKKALSQSINERNKKPFAVFFQKIIRKVFLLRFCFYNF